MTEGIADLMSIEMFCAALSHPLLIAFTDKIPPADPVVVVIVFEFIPEVIVQVLDGKVQA